MDIYLDTSVVSALFDQRNPERMAITEDFFETVSNYRVFISELTLAEIENTPDATLGDKMRERVREFEIIELDGDVEQLAQAYVEHGAIGSAYAEDAYHIAAAVANGIPSLLSWNFRTSSGEEPGML